MLEESDTIIIAVRSCTSKDAEQFQVELPPLPNFHCRVECKFGGYFKKSPLPIFFILTLL